ncbi:hypothetical protein ACIP6Q_37710 [Streptomyces bobili]
MRDLVLGLLSNLPLLSDLPRKNCSPIAEWAGEASAWSAVCKMTRKRL